MKMIKRIIQALKRKNRTLLEMHIGMLFFGVCCQIAGALIVEAQGRYAVSLWFGVAFWVSGSHKN